MTDVICWTCPEVAAQMDRLDEGKTGKLNVLLLQCERQGQGERERERERCREWNAENLLHLSPFVNSFYSYIKLPSRRFNLDIIRRIRKTELVGNVRNLLRFEHFPALYRCMRDNVMKSSLFSFQQKCPLYWEDGLIFTVNFAIHKVMHSVGCKWKFIEIFLCQFCHLTYLWRVHKLGSVRFLENWQDTHVEML